MVKNSLEAIPRGETVRVWAEGNADTLTFHVFNPGVVPAEVARQIFKRSFSTKSSQGRGLGTYSMKLFGETYLGGRVSFTSDDGIVFTISLPRSPSAEE
jgi:hypothetical protein